MYRTIAPQIKLCGIRRLQDIEAFYQGEVPEYVGFIFAPSKRFISPQDAKGVITALRGLNKEIQIVGVFVNESLKCVNEVVEDLELDVVQLHGEEDDKYIRKVYAMNPNLKVWKAIRLKEIEDLEKIKGLKCDNVVIDAYKEGGYGGTGKAIENTLLSQIGQYYKGPYFLAGGISYERLSSISKVVKPFGLDISSSIETGGYKDNRKIRQIIKGIREEIAWRE